MMNNSILKKDRVASTVQVINNYLRSATNQLGAKKCVSDYYVMTGNTVNQLISVVQNRVADTVLVVDDPGLQIVTRLWQEGAQHITLCLTRVPEEQMSLIKFIIARTFPDIKVNIISQEGLTKGMTFDLIIANPPYGAIGANITKALIDTVEFKEYVNLLPANDYKRNTTKDLFNYQSDMEAIQDGFADAAVTTHVAKIHKDKVNSLSEAEFISSCTFDSKNKLYNFACRSFAKAADYAIAITDCPVSVIKTADNTKSFIFSERDGANRHLPYSKNSVHYRWAVTKDVTADWILSKYHTRIRAGEEVTKCHYIEFNTTNELTNFVNFIYSVDGFRFIAMLFECYSTDYLHPSKIFPKVDWTRAWTVEEILEEYDYTEEEIQAVIEDLKNYKGMED